MCLQSAQLSKQESGRPSPCVSIGKGGARTDEETTQCRRGLAAIQGIPPITPIVPISLMQRWRAQSRTLRAADCCADTARRCLAASPAKGSVSVEVSRWLLRPSAMTSHILDGLARRAPEHMPTDDCVFCDIIARRAPAHIVGETDAYLAFLDVLPIRAGVFAWRLHTHNRTHTSRAQDACCAFS